MRSFTSPFVKAFLPVAVLLLLAGCQSDIKSTPVVEPHSTDLFHDYYREKELSSYLKKEFDIRLGAPGTDTILFIPLNSCDKCVQGVLRSAQKNDLKGTIVIAGDIKYKPAFKEMYEDVIANKNCLIDTNAVFNKYNIDVFTPTLVIMKKPMPRFSLIDFQNWKKVCKVISWKV